jgi:predicted nucleic acid-binding protein
MDLVADTNIWLRLADDRAVQHPVAKQAIIHLLAQGARLHLVPQNIVEFWAVATRPQDANGLGWNLDRTAAEVSNMRQRFSVLSENERIFEKWSEAVIENRISGKRVHDARLAAQLLVHGVSHLLTFNGQDFAKFSWISILRPEDLLPSENPP